MPIMGWSGFHFSDFTIKRGKYICVDPQYNLFEDDEDLQREFYDDGICYQRDGSITKLSQIFPDIKKLTYVYDAISNWTHIILIEKFIDDYENDYPIVLKYKGNCPPEECDGLCEYYCLLKSDDEKIKEWLESKTATYNLDVVNNSLRKYNFRN